MKKSMRTMTICLALLLLLIPAHTLWAAGTDGITDVEITVQYGQTEARSMLDMINAFRTGPEAWQYDSSGNKEKFEDLNELRYDYRLEAAAMQRAAEIAVYFEHERPDGSICFTVCDGIGGENIAAGVRTAAQALELWKETDEPYEGQGHRRNMLGLYGTVGIGHAYFNGRHFWVQEFGYGIPAEEGPAANDAETSVQIQVREEYILERTMGSVQEQSVVYGETAGLPAISMRMRLTETWPKVTFPVDVDCTWTVEDETVAAIENGKIVGKKAGHTALRVNEMPDVTVPLTVMPISVAEAQIRLAEASCAYDGTAQTPEVRAVVVKDRELIPDEDYTIGYEDNTRPGTAKVVVTGIGNYQGTAEQSFEIICEHRFDQGQVIREATCTEDGERLYTCGLCQSTKTEPILATGHTEVKDEASAPTCTETGKTEGSHCSVCGEVLISQETIPAAGHRYQGAPVFIWSGSAACRAVQTCTVCQTEQSRTCTVTSEIIKEASCTEDGRADSTAAIRIDGRTYTATKTSVIEKTGHAFQTSITKATPKKDGKITEECSRCGTVRSENVLYRPKTIRLSAKDYVYNGKEKRPSVTVTDKNGKTIRPQDYKIDYAKGRKAVGIYKVTVIFRGGRYTGQMSDTFTIRPQKVSLSRVQNVKGRKMKIQWKRAASVSGYQIQYAASSSFKGARSVQADGKKVSQTIGRLAKGKRCYVRIRAYKTVSGKKIYSDWSAKKNVVIRK